MPDINWSKNAVAGAAASAYGDARQAEESTSNSINTTSSNIISVRFFQSTGRGGGQTGFSRSYMAFDFTGYTTGTITNLALHWKGTTSSNGSHSTRVVRTDAFGSSTNFSNYVSTDWWESLYMSTTYSNSFTWLDSTAAQSVSLNSGAVTFAQANSYLQIALVNNTYDYSGINPGSNVSQISYGNWSSNNMFLRFTYADAGYPNTVNSITSANISKINSIATANISKVNSVS